MQIVIYKITEGKGPTLGETEAFVNYLSTLNYLLDIYHAPGTVPRAGATDMTMPSLCPRGSTQAGSQRANLKVAKPPG